MRRKEWEDKNNFDHHDLERTWTSRDVLPGDLEDFQVPMVVIGTDVEALFPSLDIDKVGDRVKEAVLCSTITWEGVNYMV